MKTKLYILFAIVLSTLFFVSCKKYPEDHRISLKRPSKRILGTWLLDKYIVNDIDSTNLIPPAAPCQWCSVYPPLLENGGAVDGHYYYYLDSKNGINGIDGGGGLFNLVDNKNNFRTSISEPTKSILCHTNVHLGIESIWQIFKLTNSEFWIKQNFNGLTYELHLKKLTNKT